MALKKEILIGCSGYYYSSWKGKFYPGKLPSSKWLEYYSSIFNTVELNSTFYRLPRLSTLQKYAAATPDNFKFSVKASRYITHILRLKESRTIINDFTILMEEGLSDKLHRILFQLPPSFKYTPENMEAILNNIPPSEMNVIELRHISWWNDEVLSIFKKHGYTFCSVDYPGLPDTMIATSKIFYLRLHGTPELFKSSYETEKLKTYYANFPKGCKSYSIYFNNTYYEAGYKNALELLKIVKGT